MLCHIHQRQLHSNSNHQTAEVRKGAVTLEIEPELHTPEKNDFDSVSDVDRKDVNFDGSPGVYKCVQSEQNAIRVGALCSLCPDADWSHCKK